MSSAHYEGDFWGMLINPDKSPAPLLEQLCLAIAQIMTSFDEYATSDLTPERLATFYGKVGGNYDVLFLDTKSSALSFIYQRLGCFHSIQPSTDPYKPPSVPALQPNGFVRWQTIQLLLDPEEHCRYLQNAVALWDIEHPNGGYFPKDIPRDAFPAESDPEMVNWHEEVSRRFEFDYWKKNIFRSSPPSFGTYHSHFSQKDTSSKDGYSQDHQERQTHRQPTTSHRRHATTTNIPPINRPQRRRSAEMPSGGRRVHSTFVRRPEEFQPEYTSPRGPSPPTWPKPSRRGRESASSRPVSPGTMFGNETSDASSEDSGLGVKDPRGNRYSYHDNLSPPSSHARRHSHEAYARRPRKELSPDSHRRHGPRETYASPDSGRLYDSDGARRVRSARVYPEEYHAPHPMNLGVFREHVFAEAARASPGPEMPVHPHAHHRHVNTNYPYVMRPHADLDACVMEEPRRASYRGTTHPASPPERMRFASTGNARAPRWAMPTVSKRIPVMAEMDYSRGRRTPMYER
ncbi:uncharacterized protein KD926_003346 [Aspergillus affinis]|uniref:uncharacterized protein n=1 Tax=Aspergillus affinis TaxID=1070780 RepID=UPI0022FEC88B|nr:uncharacterized protein KD926_003346 [Aspergillus affinis]KAI9043576.1 hypothetical protein KD926_003346 [Aspergillus affinis]